MCPPTAEPGFDHVAVLAQLAVRATVPPPGLALGDLAQPRPQASVIDARRRRLVTLRETLLASQPAGPTLAELQAVDEHVDRLTPAGRAQKFPGMRMLAEPVASGTRSTVA